MYFVPSRLPNTHIFLGKPHRITTRKWFCSRLVSPHLIRTFSRAASQSTLENPSRISDCYQSTRLFMVHLVSLLIVDLTFNVSKWSGDQYKPLSNASVPAVTLVSNEKSQVLGSPTLFYSRNRLHMWCVLLKLQELVRC